MKENTIALVIRWIGGGVIFVGLLVSLFIGLMMENWIFLFVGMLSSVISGVMILGFSEIICLLQLNVYKTEKLIKILSPEQEKTDC